MTQTLEVEAHVLPALEPDPHAAHVELAVFLLLIVPPMVLSWFAATVGSEAFGLVATSTVFRDIALVALVVFFLWRNGEPLARLGWTRRNRWKDIAVGAALFPVVFVGSIVIGQALQHLGLPGAPLPAGLLPARTPADLALAVLLVLVVAVSEETIFRGYLLLRFQGLLRGTAGAVVASSVIFASGHGYEGPAGLVTVGLMGAVYALVYLWRRSLVAPITLHLLQDLTVLVVLPYVR